ncbi:ASST-domain-containing protein [Aspergillus karnatakaensis]|uniref:ASST-domain-containing protein n=1 Tax=Aspergillus karnatakaensis TaxID=1810916 RepID=UPI003CCD38B6
MEQHTFRRRGLGLRGADDRVSPGYVLYAPLTSRTAHLVSTTGKEVHRWTLPHRAGRHARILPNGNLAYNGVHPDSPNLFPMWKKYCGGVMMQLNSEGEVVRKYSDPHAHHDQNHLNDGTLLYTTLEPLTPEEASQVRGGIPGSEAPDGTVYADCIKLVNPWSKSNDSSSSDFEGTGTGGAKLLWSWRAIDHLDLDIFKQHQDYPREHWPLINSVALDKDGNIIASSRNTSSVFILSRATGKVIWHLTSPIVNQQHCAHEINESGDLLILDNGVFRPGLAVPFSRAIVVSRESKQITWEYKDRTTGGLGFFTPFMGSALLLSNQNVLIAEAATGRIFEVTKEGDVVWEFAVPQLSDYKAVMGERDLEEMEKIGFSYESNAVFRAYKYTPEEVPWLDSESN